MSGLICDTCPETRIRPEYGRMIWDEDGCPGDCLYARALGTTYLKGIRKALCLEHDEK